MVRQTAAALGERDNVRGGTFTRREVASIRMTQEQLGVARCPLCHAALVARQGRRGPYFYCRCAPRPGERRSVSPT